MNLFQRFPRWLYDQFNLAEPRLPTHLAEDVPVQAVVELGQGGWGALEVFLPVLNLSAATGATLIGPDGTVDDGRSTRDHHVILLALEAENEGANPCNLSFGMRDRGSTGSPPQIRITNPITINAGGFLPFVQVFADGFLRLPTPLILPQGTALTWIASEPITVRMLIARVPAGTKLF